MIEIESVYCINIRKRPDRLEHFRMECERAGMYRLSKKINLTTNWERNLNGEDITQEWLKENNMGVFDWQMECDYKWWNRPLTKGEMGCTISHTEIWKRATGYTLILEDDVLFTPNWIAKLNITINKLKDWDLLYLGRVPQKTGEKIVCTGIVKPDYSYCTYAYILSPRGIKKIQKYEVEKSIIPADEFLTSTYIEHPRMDVRLKYPPALNAYAMEPPIILQRNKEDAGSDTT
jgi:collagen beta-1,O-galactosyltransferase